MPRYKVQLQHGISGEITEKVYVTRWDPEKIDSEEVARACAAEATIAGGKIKDGFRHPQAGLTAVIQEDV